MRRSSVLAAALAMKMGCAGVGCAGVAGGLAEPAGAGVTAEAPAPPVLPVAASMPLADPGRPIAEDAETLPAPPTPDPASLSPSLSCGLRSPMPGGVTMGYAADTGLDVAGIKLPVFAIAAGEIVYAEAGHTLWSSPRDTDLAVLLKLDQPIAFGDRQVTHVWYAHLSKLDFEQAEDVKVRRRVVAGERLGISGVANGAWHIHLGLLLDGDTSQRWGTFLLEDDARKVLCDLRPVQRLPAK